MQLINKQEAIKAIFEHFPQLRQESEAEYVLRDVQEIEVTECENCKYHTKDAFGMIWCTRARPFWSDKGKFCGAGEE